MRQAGRREDYEDIPLINSAPSQRLEGEFEDMSGDSRGGSFPVSMLSVYPEKLTFLN